MPTYPITVTFGKLLESSDVNPTIQGLNGEVAEDFLTLGTLTHRSTSTWQSGSSAVITDPLNTIGGTSYSYIGLAHQSAAVTAGNNVPVLNLNAHIRPNGGIATGASFRFHAVRYGSTSTSDGDLAAHYSLLSHAESQSSFTPHDEVAIAGLVTIHKNGDARGGIATSPAIGYSLYGETTNFSTTGQAIGCELKINNLTGADATAPNGAAPNRNTALQLVSAVNEGFTVAGSRYNSIGLLITSSGHTVDESFINGIQFEQNSVKEYLIDAYQASWNSAEVPFARLANSSPVVAQNNANTTPVVLFRLTTADTHDIFLGKSANTTDQAIRFVTQTGSIPYQFNPTGIMDFNGASAVTALSAGGTALTLPSVNTATANMPSAAAASAFLAITFQSTKYAIALWPRT